MLLDLIERRGALQSIGSISDYVRWLVNHQSHEVAAGVAVNESSAMSLTYVYACIRVLAETVGHLPLNLYRRTDDGRQEATDHRLWSLLHLEPNPWMSSQVWRETMMVGAAGHGNGYSWIERNRNGQPVALWPLQPDKTHPEIKGGTLCYRTSLQDSTEQVVLPALDVLHLPCISLDGVKGLSPVQAAKQAIGLGLAAQEFGARFFGNGANPRMVIEHPTKIVDAEKFRETFDQQFSGVRDSHGTVVLSGGATLKPISIPPEDAQFLQTRQFNRTEVCGLFRVPPHMVGDLERSTFSNAEQMDLNFARHTIAPWCSKWERELDRKLLTGPTERGQYFSKINMNALMRGDTQTRSDWYDKALQQGWMSRNEVRAKEDLPREDGLDEFMTPLNYAPIGSPPESDIQRMQPLVRAMADRLASCERRALERCGEDVSAAASFWSDHVGFVERHARPLAESLDGVDADAVVEAFRSAHIDQQLAKCGQSIAEAIPHITSDEIVRTFNEVAHGNRTQNI